MNTAETPESNQVSGENVSPVVSETLAVLNGIDRSKLNPSQLLIVDGWLQLLQPECGRSSRRLVQEAFAPLCMWELEYLKIVP